MFVFWGRNGLVEFYSVQIISDNATGIVILDGDAFKVVNSTYTRIKPVSILLTVSSSIHHLKLKVLM